MVGGDALACRSELDSAREWEGSEEGSRERALRELKGEERAEGAGRWRRGTRHGSARRRGGASAAVLGVRAGRWRRVAKSRSIGEEPGARRVAD